MQQFCASRIGFPALCPFCSADRTHPSNNPMRRLNRPGQLLTAHEGGKGGSSGWSPWSRSESIPACCHAAMCARGSCGDRSGRPNLLVAAGKWRTDGAWFALDCVALAGTKTATVPARQCIYPMLLRRQMMGAEMPGPVRPGLRGRLRV